MRTANYGVNGQTTTGSTVVCDPWISPPRVCKYLGCATTGTRDDELGRGTTTENNDFFTAS